MLDWEMMKVANEMFDLFIAGETTEYRNETLTQRAVDHPSTQRFIEKTKAAIIEFLQSNNGDITSSNIGTDLDTELKKIDRPAYSGLEDLFTGLKICVNDTWGYYIEIKNYQFDGTHFNGIIKYTIYDHFGLDTGDITDKNWYLGQTSQFGAWYVLQHYTGCEGKYKPFITYIETEVPFSGKVNK